MADVDYRRLHRQAAGPLPGRRAAAKLTELVADILNAVTADVTG
jgi:hypothetical protein